MPFDDEKITIEIQALRSKDMENVKRAFRNLEKLLLGATSEGKNEINKALTWARTVYGTDLDYRQEP